MFTGQSANLRDNRPQLVDLNLVPPEFRPRPFPLLTAGLCSLLIGSLLIVYAIFYAKTYTDLEIDRLGNRVAQAQGVVEAATGDPAALAHQEQLRALRDDYKSLSQRQINWGDVFQVIGDVPDGTIVRTASQTGYGVTVSGSAVNQAAAAAYLDRLKNSGLFVDSAIQIGPASGPNPFETGSPTPAPTMPAPPPPKPLIPAVAPPVAPVAPLAPAPQPIQQQPVQPSQPRPVVLPARTAVPRPTITPTPTVFLSPTVTASPTPAFDFFLKSSQQVPSSNPLAMNSDIKGSIVDANGNLVTGFQVEIDSEGQPPWSSLSTTSQANGTFSFNVSHGKFTVYVIGGNSQPAVDLYTGADGVPGTYGYVIVFQKTFSGSIPNGPSVTASPYPTLTSTPTASSTPVAPGENVASLGCATAYLVKNGAPAPVPNNPDPKLAIDGNLGTEWNSGTIPNSGTQVIWQWSLYSNPVPD
ncbi:MAG TPA: PilN domain-containing protein, partial [Chloroflexota bacterium]|nr:PilN domain-containing protein [Chloroflexota bacterium]